MDEASSVAVVVVEVEVVPSIEMVCQAMYRPGSLVRDSRLRSMGPSYECLHILLQRDLNTHVRKTRQDNYKVTSRK